MTKNYIKDRVGRIIGYSQQSGNQVEYWMVGKGGLIGVWHPQSSQYIQYGTAGNGIAAQSDIGAGEVYRVWQILNP